MTTETATRPLVFLDTETTSLRADRRPWEIALIRREPDSTESVALLHISDVDLSAADPDSLAVGGFHTRHAAAGELAEVVSEATAAGRVELATRGATVVGAVPSFDTETLTPMLHRHGLAPSWHHRLRCVETLTAGHLQRDPGGLAAAARALGVPVDDASLHTALGDAILARSIWDRIMTSKPLRLPKAG